MHFYNFTKNNSASFALYPPSGISLQGLSLEWILERPSVNGVVTNIARFGADPFTDDYGYTYSPSFFTYSPSSDQAGDAIWDVWMTSNNTCWFQNPVPAGCYLAEPILFHPYALWFYGNTGGAIAP